MSSGWKKGLTFILGALFVVAFVAFVVGQVVRQDLLSPALYTNALEENNAYDRVYEELLADPVVQETFKETTGIGIDLISEELYAQIVSALYLIVPPQRMEVGIDQFLTGLTAYLNGETDKFEEDLDLGAALTPEVLAANLAKAATLVTVAAIDKTEPLLESKTEQLIESELTAYMDQIGLGNLGPIPSRLLRSTVRGITSTQSERLIKLMLGPTAETASDETLLQMEAALAADDLPSAISIAVIERIEMLVLRTIAASESRLATADALVSVSDLAMTIGETRDSLVANLNMARGYVATLQTLMPILAVLMLVLLLLIVWLNSDSIASALRASGWTLLVSSGMVMLVWAIAGFWLRSTLQSKLGASQVGPASLDGIIDDVVGSLTRGVWDSVWTTALWFLLLGLLLLAFGYSKQLLAFLERLLKPVWDYKWWVLGGALAVFVLLPLMWRLFTAEARAAELPCNGHAELCDRPINEVAYASSHNSMSIAEYGWIWPMHDGTITDQLNAGVRALLIDSHYMDTDLIQEETLAKLPEELQPVARKAIDAFSPERLQGTFLCHQLCALGYSSLPDGLEEVRAFLEENPREVLFLIIQDEITPEDTAGAIEDAGLLPYIYLNQDSAAWPTLRQLIDNNKRLLVMAENEGPPPDWYINGWDVTEETPYTFIMPDQFSCEPNRGGTGKPFFLLNHWIQRGSPNRVDAAVVNEYDFLLGRAQQCAAERGQMPNFVAVNFYSQGDLMDVVDTLNGVYEPMAE